MTGKVQIESVGSVVLKANPLGDPRLRQVPIYLPPSYGTIRGRRYPIIYCLAGFTGGGRSLLNFSHWRENLPERFDRLIAEGKANADTILEAIKESSGTKEVWKLARRSAAGKKSKS